MSLPNADVCWQAVVASDATYDGQFVVAVQTTRIYCRPSCPARLPKRKNVSFFPMPAAAEAKGYRACKRCHPKQIDPCDEQAALVQQVCTHIQMHIDEPLTLEELGAAVGWSTFHLQRTFKDIMGITPKQYTDAQRMATFKHDLKAGDSVTDAALNAGYSSSSRVHAHAQSRMGMTPSTYQQGGTQETITYSITECVLGYLLVARTERGICTIKMGDDDLSVFSLLHDEFPQAHLIKDDEQLQEALELILAYLQGWQPHLDLPLDIRTTAFQQRVLTELLRIPYGETRTYGEIATAIGKPKSARAVGRACGSNPVPLIIPCHRVVGSTGKLTGYAFGTERKQQLLDLEHAHKSETSISVESDE